MPWSTLRLALSAQHITVRAFRGFGIALRTSLSWLLCRRAIPLWILCGAAFAEVIFHLRSFNIRPSEKGSDEPFVTQCHDITASTQQPRENAVIVMLARNSEILQALHSIQHVEARFNRWFHYPIVLLNNEPWSQHFKRLVPIVTSGDVHFGVIPHNLWTFPDHINSSAALASIEEQGSDEEYSSLSKAGMESYHHMCRFYSGEFYNLDILKPYKWYWRIEPDIDLACDMTYDPFVEMAKRGKLYGHTIAIQEEASTCPSLFHHAAEYKRMHHIRTTQNWKSIMTPSWMIWPLRALTSDWSNRDALGDIWSRCQYWSNFEIASLDFFRGKEYQDFFRYLDLQGGFYFERWGDAPVHSLAVAMFLEPDQVHNFQDVGYRHQRLFQCPDVGVGCRCKCDNSIPRNYPDFCLNKLTAPNSMSV